MENFPVQEGINHSSGLDAFVLNNPSGDLTVAFRGTEVGLNLSSLRDLLNDAVLATGASHVADFFNVGQVAAIDQFLINAGLIDEQGQVNPAYLGKITFTGHSLGGHLALMAAYKYPELVKGVYTFNGAGMAPLDRLWFSEILPVISNRYLDESKVFNLYADKGIELTAAENGWFGRPGARQAVFIEASSAAMENHSIARMVKSLSMYRLLQMLDPSLNSDAGMRDIYRMLDATSNVPSATLQRMQDQLVQWAQLQGVDGAASDIEVLYQALQSQAEMVSIITQSAKGQSSLLAMAGDDTSAGRAARYALLELQAAAFIGVTDPLSNEPGLSPDAFTRTFWQDRSLHYQHMMSAARRDSLDYVALSGAAGAVIFKDEQHNTSVSTRGWGAGHDRLTVLWGKVAGGSLDATAGHDHAYGWSGADQLYGLDGNDRLAGYAGNDVLVGGRGHDVLIGGEGKDSILLDWSHDQEGHDRVEGADWVNDTISIDGDKQKPFEQQFGFSNVYQASDETRLFIRDDEGYLLLDREHGFANSLWLPMVPGADQVFDLADAEPMDVAALLGEATFNWNATEHYGEKVLADGRMNEGDRGEGWFFGSQLTDFAEGGDLDDHLQGNDDNDWLQGGGSMDLLLGGPGSDYLYGGTGRDFLFGQDFWDTNWRDLPTDRDFLDGGSDDDWLLGGNGEDTLLGQNGIDYLFGNPGNDWLSGGKGADHLWGDSAFYLIDRWVRDDAIGGSIRYRYFRPMMQMLDAAGASVPWGEAIQLSYNDVLEGGDGDDWLFGELGNDVLIGGKDNDVLMGDRINRDPHFDESEFLYGFTAFGKSTLVSTTVSGDPVLYKALPIDLHGNDMLLGGSGNDYLYGNGGDDVLQGGNGDDYLHGDDTVLDEQSLGGNDRLFGGSGADQLVGGFGDDWLEGGTGHDALYGNQGADQLFGNEGDDALRGGEGADALYGGIGNDHLYGDDGDDFLSGDEGFDALYGGDGQDWLTGGDGNDRLMGDDGDDVLEGGIGNDLLQGGEGQDYYRFFAGDGHDVLMDPDPDTQLRFEGGITRDDLMLSTIGDIVYLRYSISPTDVIELHSSESVASYALTVWSNALQQYSSLTMTDLQDNRSGDGAAALSSGTDYNDNIDLSNIALLDEPWHGGQGDDVVVAADIESSVYGDWGNDTLIGGHAPTALYGGVGNDTLIANDDMNYLAGGLDDDVYDIGYFRPSIVEQPEGGQDVLIARSDHDETWQLPDGIETLQLDAAGHRVNIQASMANQFYHVVAESVDIEVNLDSGFDVLDTEGKVNIIFGEGISAADISLAVESDAVVVSGGPLNHVRITSDGGASRIIENLSMHVSGEAMHWFPLSPIQYFHGSSESDYWASINMPWLNGIQPMAVFDDAGGIDGISVSVIQEPKSLAFNEMIRSDDDLVLRLTHSNHSSSVFWQPDVQWRVRDWFVSPDHQIEYLSGPSGYIWRHEEGPVDALLADVMDVNHAPLAQAVAVYVADGDVGIPLDALISAVVDVDRDAISIVDIWSPASASYVDGFDAGWIRVSAVEGEHPMFYRATDGLLSSVGMIDMHVGHVGEAFVAEGNGASNVFIGGSGDDAFWGSIGQDYLWGNAGGDRLVGSDGDDFIDGGDGDDKLRSGAGCDQLYGGDGNDFLRGDGGNDQLYGGSGSDNYIYKAGDGHDVIRDRASQGEANALVIIDMQSVNDLWMHQDDADLVISFLDAPDDSVVVKDWFSVDGPYGDAPGQLFQLKAKTAEGTYVLDNGTMLVQPDQDAFDALFYAMSGHARPAGSQWVPDGILQSAANAWMAV